MYKVFINEIALNFTDFTENLEPVYEREYDSILAFGQSAEEIVLRLRNSGFRNILIRTDYLAKEWEQFCTLFVFVEAAGGLVRNEALEYLFIKRLGVWDLPKGHLEKGESLDQAALREVLEECGDLNLELEHFIRFTYHCYFFKDKWRVKRTAWYAMNSKGEFNLIPQEEEGIQEVSFLNKDQIYTELPTSYANIKSVLKDAGINL